MQHPIVRGIGFSLLAFFLIGLCGSVAFAMLHNQAFLWNNAYGVPVGTYSTAAVLVVAGCVWVFWLLQRARTIFSGSRTKHDG